MKVPRVSSMTFTPTEAAALTGLSVKRVRKELEAGVIRSSSPPRLSWPAMVLLELLSTSELELPVARRADILRRLSRAMEAPRLPSTVSVSGPFVIALEELHAHLLGKVLRFERWKCKLVARPDVMGGETVFPKSRVTVRRVGTLLDRGVSEAELREDYPMLTRQDLELARVFVRAYPRVGRPRTRPSAAA